MATTTEETKKGVELANLAILKLKSKQEQLELELNILELEHKINLRKNAIQPKHSLRQSIINIQTNMQLVFETSGVNKGLSKPYAYPKESDLLRTLKPELAKENIGYKFELDPTRDAETKLVLTEKGATMSQIVSPAILTLFTPFEEEKYNIYLAATNTDAAKSLGSALTYSIRYWLMKIFGLPTDGLDPDTTENTQAVGKITKETDGLNININNIKAPEVKANVLNRVEVDRWVDELFVNKDYKFILKELKQLTNNDLHKSQIKNSIKDIEAFNTLKKLLAQRKAK